MSVDPVAAVVAVCPWPIDSACLEATWDELDAEVQERATALASATLRRLTGYRVGGCPVKVRPCRQGCAEGSVGYAQMSAMYGQVTGYWPHIGQDGFWVNSCGCQGTCHCGPAMCSVRLPAPVGRVDEVMVNGVALEAEDYRVAGNTLVWAGDGECPWPTCQDMSLPDTEDGTFSVTYLNSLPVDTLGAYAAGILANEFAKACSGAKGCRLPSGTTAVTRQGVSYEIVAGSFPDGFSGIKEVDAYIALYNPRGRIQGASVWSPDMPQTPVG